MADLVPITLVNPDVGEMVVHTNSDTTFLDFGLTRIEDNVKFADYFEMERIIVWFVIFSRHRERDETKWLFGMLYVCQQ